MRFGTYIAALAASVCLPCLLPITGCDTSIEPFVGLDEPYTIWGYFNATSDTQWVRVIPLPGSLAACPGDSIDAEVLSTDFTTGEKRTWRHRYVRYPDGSCGHVFWSPFRAGFGHTYRLEVTRSDGQVTSAEGTIPLEAQLIRPEPADYGTTATFGISGEIDRIVRTQVRYQGISVPPINPWPPGATPPPVYRLETLVSYDGEEERAEDGWQVRVDLKRDRDAVVAAFQSHCLSELQIALRRVTFSVLIADSEWMPPGGVFDPEELVEPGTFSNVTNGFGFYGAGYALSERWTPSLGLQLSLGYRLEGACLNNPADIPECYVYEYCE